MGSYSRTISYINLDLSQNDAFTGEGGFSLQKYVADKYNLQVNTNFIYLEQVSSINTAASVRYWTQKHTASVNIYLIKLYDLGTSAVYTWQEKTAAFSSNTSVLLWNSYLSRNFLHDRLVLRAQFNNILNQSAGITRSNAGNVNTQSSTNILGRYWMLSAIYHFDKSFKKK